MILVKEKERTKKKKKIVTIISSKKFSNHKSENSQNVISTNSHFTNPLYWSVHTTRSIEVYWSHDLTAKFNNEFFYFSFAFISSVTSILVSKNLSRQVFSSGRNRMKKIKKRKKKKKIIGSPWKIKFFVVYGTRRSMLNKKKKINRPLYISTHSQIYQLEFPSIFTYLHRIYAQRSSATSGRKKSFLHFFFFQHGLNTGYEFFNKYGIALFAF